MYHLAQAILLEHHCQRFMLVKIRTKSNRNSQCLSAKVGFRQVYYNITINGNLRKTSNNFIDIALSPGINIIEVKTDKDCQGVYEETIFISEDIMLSPNPVKSSSTLWVGGNDQNVNMTLFDITGTVIWTRNEQVPYSRSVNVPFSNVRSGLYILKVDSETIKKSIKVIKE